MVDIYLKISIIFGIPLLIILSISNSILKAENSKKLDIFTKFLIIIIEVFLSIAIPFLVYRNFYLAFPEHYKAEFIEGFSGAILFIFSIPIYGVLFIYINKVSKENSIKFIFKSILFLVVGLGIQIGLFFLLDNPYTVDIQGW